MTFFLSIFATAKRRLNSTELFHALIAKNRRLMLKLNNSSVQMLLLGICLGVTLGIAFVPIDMNFGCGNNAKEDTVPYKLPTVSAEVESPINIVASPDPMNLQVEIKNTSGEKFRRPRYFSTELGLRRKLIGGIILSNSSCFERIIQINQTLSQRVDKLLFFVGGKESGRRARELKSLGLSGVVEVISGENSSEGQVNVNDVTLRVIKYLGERFGESYDHFFFSLDKFYVHGRLLMDLVGKISVSQDFMWGVPGKNACILDRGFVLSRRLIQKLSMKVDYCLNNPSLNATINLSKCFRYILNGKLACDATIQNLQYTSSYPNSTIEELSSSITIGPLNSPGEFKIIHSQISKSRLATINSNIINIQRKIQVLQPKHPAGFQTTSWPLGLPAGFVPKTRFDILRWTYFDNENLYAKNDQSTVEITGGIDLQDLNHITNTSRRYINVGSSETASFLQNGYRRFNPTRGMEYILDFRDATNKLVRVEGLRPLCQMELVPMPFVTENQRVTIVVPITSPRVEQVKRFLDRFFNFSTDHKLNTVLIFIIVTTNNNNQRTSGETFLDSRDVKEIQKMVSYYNGKIPKNILDRVKAGYMLIPKKKSLPISLLNGIEAVINRIMGTSALILVADVNVDLKDEFLNRVRMNTIFNAQVFSPIPFVEHNPTVYLGKNSNDGEIEVNRYSGYFDSTVFRFFSFYAADFVAARRKLSSANLTDFEGFQDLSSLTHLFVKFTSLFVFRGPEPSLKIPFAFPNGCSSFEDCVKTKWGTRAQLAKMILNSIPKKAKPD